MGGFVLRRLFFAMAFILAATDSRADWQADLGTFRIGIVAEPGAGNTVAGLAGLTDAYAKALGMKVEFLVAKDFPALVEAQTSGRVQYAVYSATAYAAAVERCGCVEPLAAPVGTDGAIGIRSVLISRSPALRTTADLEGKRVAILPADSVTGNQLPLSGLMLASGPLTGSEPFLVHVDGAQAAEAMLLEGSVDAMFGWAPAAVTGDLDGGTFARLTEAGIPAADLAIAWKSDVLRFGPHAVRSDLDPEAKRRLSQFLLGLKSFDPEMFERLEPDRQGGFVAVTQADYAAALGIVRTLQARAALR